MLNAAANQLARHLRSLGVGPEVRVGVSWHRRSILWSAMLGILKAGGAYVPLDPAYPPERLTFMMADAGTRGARDGGSPRGQTSRGQGPPWSASTARGT